MLMAMHTCQPFQTYRRDISVYDDKNFFRSVQWRDIFFSLFRGVWGHAPLENCLPVIVQWVGYVRYS